MLKSTKNQLNHVLDVKMPGNHRRKLQILRIECYYDFLMGRTLLLVVDADLRFPEFHVMN